MMIACSASAGNVLLTWDPNPDTQRVIRYGVYERLGNQHVYFGFVKTNVATLLNVPVGDHCFVVTALNAGGESGFSQEACVTVITSGPNDGQIILQDGRDTPGNGNGNTGTLPPLGDFEQDYSDQALLWDLSGYYDEVLYDDGTNRLEADYVMEVDGMGRMDGTGTFDLNISNPDRPISMRGTVTIRGRISSVRDVLRATYRLSFEGAGDSLGTPIALRSSLSVMSEMDPSQSEMHGTLRGSLLVRVDRQRPVISRILSKDFSMPVPAPADGAWTFRLQDISASGPRLNRLEGTASIDLSNGRSFSLDSMRGNFNSIRGTTMLSARGSRTNLASRGVSAMLWSEGGDDLLVDRVMIRVLGQRVLLRQLQQANP